MSLFDSPWSQLGAVGLLAVFVLAILAGRLVARSWVHTLLEQAELRVQQAERNGDRWQAAYELADKRADLFAEQLGQVLAALRILDTLVRAPHRDVA